MKGSMTCTIREIHKLMAYLKSQCREFEKNQSDSSRILVAEQALSQLISTDNFRAVTGIHSNSFSLSTLHLFTYNRHFMLMW